MADEIKDLSTTDASNVNRFPENQAPASLNDGARALEGMIARFHSDLNGSVLTTGTQPTYVYTANQSSLAAYYDGMILGVDFHAANAGGAATINVNAIGAKSIKKHNDQDLAANDIEAGMKALLIYDGTNFQLITSVANAPGALNNISEDTTPQLGASLDTNSFAINTSKGTDVASAGTLNVAGDGNYYDVTGTAAITGIATEGIGTIIGLHFDGALTLTHHTSNLVLPGGANITTAAGDEALFVEYASAQWRCLNYTKASGLPVVGSVVQSVSTKPNWGTGATTVPTPDDTKPQNTEGDEYATQAITPTATANVLEITATILVAHSAGSCTMMVALFQDSTADALATTAEYINTANKIHTITLVHRMTAGTTSSTTFKIRAGADVAGTTTVNGFNGNRSFVTVGATRITVKEFAV